MDKNVYLRYVDFYNKSEIIHTKYGVRTTISLNNTNNYFENGKHICDLKSVTLTTKIDKREFHFKLNSLLYLLIENLLIVICFIYMKIVFHII